MDFRGQSFVVVVVAVVVVVVAVITFVAGEFDLAELMMLLPVQRTTYRELKRRV